MHPYDSEIQRMFAHERAERIASDYRKAQKAPASPRSTTERRRRSRYPSLDSVVRALRLSRAASKA